MGEFYAANGIQLGLTAYSINPDGTVGLEFSVKNEGNQKTLLRYQNSYFSLSDDTGKAHLQTTDHLLTAKQVEVGPGKSYVIRSNSAPSAHTEIGYFSGKVPEQAGSLIVKVSQFADLRDMQWIIPLNAQLSSAQAPNPGTRQPVMDGFSANGITLLLANYDIRTDGLIGLQFLVRNEGNNAVLLRSQNKYFEVYDDLNNRYAQDRDRLLDPKQVLLSPGESYEIRSNSAPSAHTEIGYFSGKVPEQAGSLIVKVSQFADLRDMQWIIPLNAQLSSAQAPNPGTRQPVMDGFSANGITLLLANYDIRTDGLIGLQFLSAMRATTLSYCAVRTSTSRSTTISTTGMCRTGPSIRSQAGIVESWRIV